MENRKNISGQDKIELKNIIKIFSKRKWWLVCSSIVVLVLELIYTFLNHKDYRLIFNIVTALAFSIIIGAVFVLVVELFSRYKFRKKT